MATLYPKKFILKILSEVLAEKINNGVQIVKDGKTLINKKDLTTFMKYAEEQVGNYTPYFVIKDDFADEFGDYSIFYKRDNLSENQNIGQVVLGSRGVRVSWDKNSFEFNGEIQIPIATVTDEISGNSARIVINPRQTDYEVTLDGRLIRLTFVITGDAQQVGGYSITVSCENANFKVEDPFITVSITPVDDGTIGLSPTIIWIIVGAAVVAALVILGMAIALKRRKSSVQYVSDGGDGDGFNDDYVE